MDKERKKSKGEQEPKTLKDILDSLPGEEQTVVALDAIAVLDPKRKMPYLRTGETVARRMAALFQILNSIDTQQPIQRLPIAYEKVRIFFKSSS